MLTLTCIEITDSYLLKSNWNIFHYFVNIFLQMQI